MLGTYYEFIIENFNLFCYVCINIKLRVAYIENSKKSDALHAVLAWYGYLQLWWL